MNTLHIIGNLTGDPEIRTVQGREGPQTVCDLNVAVNRYAHGEKTVEYFRVTVWNRMAENAAKYLRKGSKVAVTGPVSARVWMSDRDGKAHCSLEIKTVQEIEYLGGGRQGDGAQGDGGPGDGDAPPDAHGFTEVDDDELPF